MNTIQTNSYVVVEEPVSGICLGKGCFASDTSASDNWDNYEPVNDPASGQKLNPGKFASDTSDDWDNYEPVNDPASGQKLNPGKFASDTSDDWDNYEPVNDPASGQKLNPGKFANDTADGGVQPSPHGRQDTSHAERSESDNWESYMPVNDPASGQKLNPGKFASEANDTWETFDPHGVSAPTSAEVADADNAASNREAANTPTGNAMFDSLWTQALQIAPLPLAVFGCGNARLCCAMNKDGKKAIKIMTSHGCQILVSASGDGESGNETLNVRLIGGAATPGLVSERGDISFAMPVETNRLIELVKRIEKWTVSFIILFGRARAGAIMSPIE